MKKLLLLSMIIVTSITMATEIDDVKAKKTKAEEQLKILESEVEIYNQSINPMNESKRNIIESQSLISNLSNKIENLTGVITSPNGSVSYNNKKNSNDFLTKAITKLEQKLATDNTALQNEVSKQQSIYDNNTGYITAARTALANLRAHNETSKEIPFYQDKITNKYIPEQDAAQKAKSDAEININKNTTDTNAQITTMKDTIASNTTQVTGYQSQLDAAKKVITDNQKIIDEWTAKLRATPNKVDFSNITRINNQINDIKNQIENFKYQITDLEAKSATSVATK